MQASAKLPPPWAIVALMLLALFAVYARADHEHAEHFKKCAKACADCQVECDACHKHCMTLLRDGKTQHAKTAQTCVDCADFCKLAASLSARQSPYANNACESCAKVCDDCGAACAKFPDDKHMAACAKACRDCAKSCREMLKHTGKATASK